MKRQLAVIGVLAVLLLAYIAVAEKPSWAREGNWAKYETELVMEGPPLQIVFGTTKLVVKEVVRLEITSVNETGFQAKAEILEYHVDPKSLEKKMANTTLKTSTVFIRFDNKPGSQPLFYADPGQLPGDGVVKAGLGETPVTAVYDKKTGWLLEAHAETTQGNVTTRVSIRLLGSNFLEAGGKTASNAEEKASTALLLSMAGVVLAVIALIVVLKRKR